VKRLVVDASVVCKWFLAGAYDESNLREARAVQADLEAGRASLVQPVHWRFEVLAVMARRRPEHATKVAKVLAQMTLSVVDNPVVDEIALRLARATGAHLFDTLYHAVALATPEGLLVTADQRYLAMASRYGQVVPLEGYAGGVEEPALDYRAIVQRALARAVTA